MMELCGVGCCGSGGRSLWLRCHGYLLFRDARRSKHRTLVGGRVRVRERERERDVDVAEMGFAELPTSRV